MKLSEMWREIKRDWIEILLWTVAMWAFGWGVFNVLWVVTTP